MQSSYNGNCWICKWYVWFNVLAKECDTLNGIDEDEDEQKLEHAKLYLVFMISNWEKDMKQMKCVVARYSLGSGISSNFLVREI